MKDSLIKSQHEYEDKNNYIRENIYNIIKIVRTKSKNNYWNVNTD